MGRKEREKALITLLYKSSILLVASVSVRDDDMLGLRYDEDEVEDDVSPDGLALRDEEPV